MANKPVKKTLPESGETPRLGLMIMQDKLAMEDALNDNTSAEDLVDRIDRISEELKDKDFADEVKEGTANQPRPPRMVLKTRK